MANLVDSKTISREVWAGWFSSLVEAYNMALYGFAAPVLAPYLFERQDSAHAILFSYALVIIAAGLFYPAGAVIFGAMGDRQGRQKICVYSTLGLALATGLMGFVPFGEWNWLLFLGLICAQYFFSGGEYYSSIVFSLEHAPKPTGLFSSLCCLFAVFGIAAANGFIAVAADPLTVRLCFIAGGIGGLLSYFFKHHCRETPPFTALQGNRETGWLPFLRNEWPQVISGVLLLGFFWVSYTFIFFLLPLLPFAQSSQFDTFKSLLFYGLCLVASGFLADRFGIRPTITAGLVLFGLAVVPLTAFSPQLLPIQLILTACACLVIGPIHAWILEQFSVQTRCRGIFLSYAVSASLFAGTTVPLCLTLFDLSHSLALCALYPASIAFSAVIWGVCYHRMRYVET